LRALHVALRSAERARTQAANQVQSLLDAAPAEWALRVADEVAGVLVREVTLVKTLADPPEHPQAEGYLAFVAARLTKAGVQ
jgi:hypothetical protein